MKTLLTFLIVFSVVVVIHELGHFYFARRAGILVREFAIGMGPKILAIKAKMGLLIPFGHYRWVVMCEWLATMRKKN